MSDTEKLVTPKFLTKEMAEAATHMAYQVLIADHERWRLPGMVYSPLAAVRRQLSPKRRQCHIVVLVPGMTDHYEEDYPDWPVYPLRPVLLFEQSFLDGADKLEGQYDNIARCKALQLWTGRNDDRTDIMPHLLYRGDAPFWGGVKRQGIVVTCSGVQPYNDKLVSGVVADTLIAMAYAAWKDSPDRKEDVDFLT